VPAALTGSDEDNCGASANTSYRSLVLFGRLAPDSRVSTGAEPAGGCGPMVALTSGVRRQEAVVVLIGDLNSSPLRARVDNPVDRVHPRDAASRRP